MAGRGDRNQWQWLAASRYDIRTTPGTVNVSVCPGVTKGNYTGKIQITTTDPAVQIKTVDVPVTYDQLCSGFLVSLTTLNFNPPWGSTGSLSVVVGGWGRPSGLLPWYRCPRRPP